MQQGMEDSACKLHCKWTLANMLHLLPNHFTIHINDGDVLLKNHVIIEDEKYKGNLLNIFLLTI